jgi:hypothetical protein
VPLIRVGAPVCKQRQDHGGADPGRVLARPAGEEAAGLARAGHRPGRGRQAGQHAGQRRQGQHHPARLRRRDRQRRPERLLPHPVRAEGIRGQLAQQFATLAPIDQIGLLSDSGALGMAGLQPASDVLALAKATPLGAEPQVWARIAGVLAGLHARYQGDDKERQRAFDAFAVARLAPVMAQIGWNARPGEATASPTCATS